MKCYLFLSTLIYTISLINSLPHFTFDGVESFYENLGETNKLYLTIYGSLSEEINLEKMFVENYIVDDLGEFQCSLLNNEDIDNERRTHKIVCSIYGTFEMNGYILEEPKVYGFDFNDEKGETTWPKQAEKRMFLIREIGEKIELDTEPILFGNLRMDKNPLDNVRKDVVDEALKSLPPRNSVEEDIMINSMDNAKSSYSLSEAEVAYMVFKWLFQNIEYDCYTSEHEYSKLDRSEKGTYNKGKGVCAGYAKIFRTMCNRLGLEAYYVSGYTKNVFDNGETPSRTNHAWNSVKIDGTFYLVDSTWGSGGCAGDRYVNNFKEYHFCTNPQIFIRQRFPADQKWQLLSQPITMDEFANRADITMKFYLNGFKTVVPDLKHINTDGKFTIDITHDSKTKKKILYHLYYLKSDSEVEQEDACWVDYLSTMLFIKCYANNKGNYILKINGGANDLQTFPNLLKYEIDCSKNSLKPKGFPHPFILFKNSDMEIITPLNSPLTRTKFINFQIKTTTFDNLYIINIDSIKNNIYRRELDYNGNGQFNGEDVYIFGKEVYISTKIEKTYKDIVKYKTIRNTNLPIDASFPKYFDAPKNILYSPLLDTLEIGKCYTFKIKCESETEIAVLDGKEFTYLNKEGPIFTKTIIINGASDEINIVYFKGNTHKKFYTYKVSN